tara:strand:+ start:3440 stop:3709 length:270 start_codon:yes stop_codon:yes gene_type:complete
VCEKLSKGVAVRFGKLQDSREYGTSRSLEGFGVTCSVSPDFDLVAVPIDDFVRLVHFGLTEDGLYNEVTVQIPEIAFAGIHVDLRSSGR